MTEPLTRPSHNGHAGPVPGGSSAEPSIAALVATATKDMSTLIRAEIELAKSELAQSAKRAAVASGLLAAAAFVAVFAFIFGCIAAAEGLANVVPRWAAFLIVSAFFLVVVGLLAARGIATFKRVSKPERTVESLKALKEIPAAASAGRSSS